MSIKSFTEKFEKLSKELEKEPTPINKLLTKSFMEKYTDFSSFDELLENSNFTVNTNTDFENLPKEEFDNYIDSVTKFSSWSEMIKKAGSLYVVSKLKL